LKRVVTVGLLAMFLPMLVQSEPAGTADEIRERLQPHGDLCRTGEDCGTSVAAAASGPKSGEDVYSQFCFACHATGASDAPLLADAQAWAPRVAKGMDVLIASTLNGLGMMPAKGACMDCSDDELRAAVDYILEQSQ